MRAVQPVDRPSGRGSGESWEGPARVGGTPSGGRRRTASVRWGGDERRRQDARPAPRTGPAARDRNHLEHPDGFDCSAARFGATPLRDRPDPDFGRPCSLDEGIQDASFLLPRGRPGRGAWGRLPSPAAEQLRRPGGGHHTRAGATTTWTTPCARVRLRADRVRITAALSGSA
ncbi:hypothetical protein LT493_18000 [Streptomyces tricolor]|nr:hypothetical protein [Streptomyces tricolor]